MENELKFHHVGIACHKIERTLPFYLSQGYSAAPVIDDPVQHVRVCFLDKADAPRLELLEPLDDSSPVARTLSTAGVTPYHLCYEVHDIEDAIRLLRGQRFLLVSGPVAAPAMENHRVAFLFKKDTGLIELVEDTTS